MSSRKEKMKVYHGIPKSVTDKNTVTYVSLDGFIKDTYEEVQVNRNFLKSTIGLGSDRVCKFPLGTIDLSKAFTIELWASNLLSGASSSEWGAMFCVAEKSKLISGQFKPFNLLNQSSKYTSMLLLHDTILLPKGFFVDDKHYHIRVTYDGVNTVKCYINGSLITSTQVTSPQLAIDNCGGLKQYDFGLNIGHNYQATPNSCVVSDIHISNIDRGDVFPTLPQDFIDGKAIIVPPLGQQQIVGDPMYSQVTELRCKYSDKTSDGLYGLETVDDCVQSLTNPEFWTSNSKWETSAKLKIKGLNGEIISGVFDADTALAKIIKESGRDTPTKTLYLNNVLGLANGDTIQYIRSDLSTEPGYKYVIESVDTANNTINMTEATVWYYGAYLFEITASSSSPVVKTIDGTNVVGTWSGLGTNEATFTLGTNTPSLTGKDLYVTYSLNMPSGNSCFPKLPYSVDKAYNEVGLEMKPVSEIIIEDDFRGKISGSSDGKITYVKNPTLVSPDSSLLREHSQSEYHSLMFGDSDTLLLNSNVGVSELVQQVYTFDIVKLVENKIGEIKARNKIEWVKQNISNVDFQGFGYATTPTNNRLSINVFDSGSNRWSGSPKNYTGTDLYPFSINTLGVSSIISNTGLVYFAVYSDISTANAQSTIFIDYVKLIVSLKMDSTYTTLYCDNKRAREDSCNPVLIQKETKTVKRYLASKENFVTECKHACTNGLATSDLKPVLHPSERVCDSNFLASSTYGTGGLDREGDNPSLRGSLAYLKPLKPLHMYTAEPMIISDGNFVPNARYLHRYIQEPNGYSTGDNGGRTMFDTSKYIAKNFVTAKPYLINQSGELKMYVYKSDFANKFYTGENMHIFDLPNRPLIL